MIRDEIYEYACPQKRATQKTSKKEHSDIVGYISIFIVVFMFSLPMAIAKTLVWCAIFGIYVIVLVFNRFDKDPYSNFLLFIGLTLAYFGTVLSYLIVDGSYKRFQYLSIVPLITLTIICIICYDIFVLINMVLKRYTAKNYNKKSYPALYTSLGTFMGGMFGCFVAQELSPQIENSLWSVWIGLLTCALSFAIAFSFFQKYVLYKLLK